MARHFKNETSLHRIPPPRIRRGAIPVARDGHLQDQLREAPAHDRLAFGESDESTTADSQIRPSRWAAAYRHRVMLTDVVIVVGALLTSQMVRFGNSSQGKLAYMGTVDDWRLSALLVVGWLLALGLYGSWDLRTLGAGPAEYRRVAVATGVVIACTAGISYLTSAEIARGFVGLAFPLGLVGLLAGRWVGRLLLQDYRRSGTHLSLVLVIGGAVSAPVLADRFRQNCEAGYRVAGLCVLGGPATDRRQHIDGFPVLGGVDDIYSTIRTSGVDTVAVAATGAFSTEQVRRLAWNLEGTDVRLLLSPALTDVAGPRLHVEPVAGLPLLDVQTPTFGGPKTAIKGVLDYLVAAIGVLLLLPIFLVTALAILIRSGRPVFHRPQRLGRTGSLFRLFQFRTTTRGGDGDTSVGRAIRRLGIDRSAQLLNVLAGNMSIVGTLPIDPDSQIDLDSYLERRIKLRPGIVGPTQGQDGKTLEPGDRLQLDLYYVENWSLFGDAVIMAHAVRSLLGRRSPTSE